MAGEGTVSCRIQCGGVFFWWSPWFCFFLVEIMFGVCVCVGCLFVLYASFDLVV